MKKTILLLSLCSVAAFANAQHNTEIELKNESIEITAGGEVNINTSDGKACYNGMVFCLLPCRIFLFQL